MPLPEHIRRDPYYPLTPGSFWVYRHTNRGAHVRTAIRSIDPLASGDWYMTIDTLFTLTGARTQDRLTVCESGIFVWHHGAWHGPDPVLPLRQGARWLVGQGTHYPVTSTVHGPAPVKLDFGRLTECLRLEQVGDDGNRVRTEWYAPGVGMARWIDHWPDHDELYELVYYCCGRTGEVLGSWPEGLAAA